MILRALPLLLAMAACAPRPPSAIALQPAIPPDAHVPDFAKRPFEPYSRANAVGIAMREWRGFGNLVNDDPPGTSALARVMRPDKQPGLWQRVGEYWWLGQDAGSKESGWSSKYNEYGVEYSSDSPAWSAAFISYIMRSAGAADRFTYSPLHADYINAAAQSQGALRVERPETYAPQPGDLVCFGRGAARAIRFEDLPATRFFGHCDIVVQAQPGQVTVVGGNVDAGVTMKHVPTTSSGTLAGPDGRVVDGRYQWFVVLRVLYDA